MNNPRFAEKSNMLWVPKKGISDVNALKRQLTLKSRFSDNPDVILWRERGDQIGLPRNNSFCKHHYITDGTFEGADSKIKFLKYLRKNQKEIFQSFLRSIAKGNTDFIFTADTGYGKTVLLLKMIAHLKRATLVIVPKTDLVKQWKEKILEFTNLSAQDIGIAQQDKCEFEGKKIVIGMIHSIWKDKYPDEFKKYFGCLVVDECHKVSATKFSNSATLFPAKYRIAATATLKRADGLETVAIQHFGQVNLSVNANTQPIPKVITVSYDDSSGDIPYYMRGRIQRRGHLLSLLSANQDRIDMLAHVTDDLLKSGRQTAVLSARVRHLEAIRENLLQRGYAKEDVGLYLGRTSDKAREKIRNESKCILATMEMLNLGTDIPKLRGLVFATPIADVRQSVGRVRRICPDVKEPVIVDVVDEYYPEVLNWYKSRKRFYDQMGSEIVHRRWR